ncbi:DUF2970 domain-containing protein [Marinobacter sp.]|uniref:DUF2970 domain-containing protein n=1 Tax=Marinobacter sp. TaxID=50741 RepID=UPI000C8E8BB3|nr:hypothetical protein [Marinobacter sp.]|tara:strand:- start:33 stop:218 length:186 start_codon:yes stop_codon:yes gene_type:complete
MLKYIKAVAWSFIGIRNSREYEKDIQSLKPIHVIIAGIIGCISFVVFLLLMVKVLIALNGG